VPSKFCRMPYEAVAVSSMGNLIPCCAFDNTKAGNHKTISEYWESDFRKEVIDSFDKDLQHPGCRSCWEQEDLGNRSKREKYNLNNASQLFTKKNISPKFVELALGNQCNVACVTCGSDFSTGWRQYDKQMPEMFADRKELLKINFKIDRPFIDDLLSKMKINPSLKIELIGGEPFFNREGVYLLEQMAENNMPNEVAMTSNCTIITDSIVDVVKKLNVHICPSIDAVGPMYSYIRNYNFNTVEDNLMKLKDAGIQLIIMPVFSVFNVWQIPNLLRWLLSKEWGSKTKIKLNNFVHGPDYCSIKNIPHELLRDTISEIKELDISEFCTHEDKLSFISSLTNYTQEDEERKLRKTLGWIKQCNTIRGVNIQDLDEDVELYMEYLEHGI